jgi:hypothetical protein
MAAPETFTLRQFLESFVRATHRGVLRRPVDEEWLQRFADELQRRLNLQPLDEVGADFVRVLVDSPEFQQRFGPGSAAVVGAQTASDLVMPAMAGRPAPLHCIPAGCSPAAAFSLRHAGLRRWAGPFDWMTIPPSAVRDALADDFITLLHAPAMEPIPPEQRPPGAPGFLCRHARLSERYGETVFHRHDPSTPEGYAALERSVIRLREALRGLHGKMLYQITPEEEGTEAVFAETAETLDRLARGVALATVALVPGKPEGPFPEMELARSIGPHRLLRARVLGAAPTGPFADPLDEVVLLRGALSVVTGTAGV